MFPILLPSPIPIWNPLAPALPPKRTPPKTPSSTENEQQQQQQQQQQQEKQEQQEQHLPRPSPAPPGHDTIRHNHATPNRLFATPKTVYINTYAQSTVRRSKVERERVVDSRTGGMTPLLTIQGSGWRVPPRELCERWSGVSEVLKGWVGREEGCRGALDFAIRQVVKYLSKGHDAALVEVCCVAGTHRSVAAAEIMGVELAEMGVDTFVRHLHRKRMPGDEW